MLCLELSDQYTFRRNRTRWLKACAERLFPPPIRYRQVWHLPQGDRSVYGWAPVPPDAIVALGHVATRGRTRHHHLARLGVSPLPWSTL